MHATCLTYDRSKGRDTRKLQSRIEPHKITGSSHLKFDLKLGRKNRTENNLTDGTYFGYNLTSYFDKFDCRGS